jgi:hypothetical protein
LLFLLFVRRGFKIFWLVILAIAALLFAILILMQTSTVQTFVAKKVVASLEKNISAKIEFSRIHLKPFNAIVLKDATILDPAPDTLRGEVLDTIARAETISATFTLKGLFKKEGLHIGKATVSDAQFMLVTDIRGSNVNRAFSTGAPKKEKVKKEQGNVLDIREVDISNFRFRLINLKKPAEKDFGINWKDLDIMVHKLEGKKLSIAGGYIQGEATELAFSEKSGYDVSQMSGKVKVGHQETVIDDMKIIDNYSDLNFKQFKMAFEKERQFFDFLHRVRLTADIEESMLNFESLAYYGKALKDRNMVMNIHDCSVDGPVSDMAVSLDFDELNSGIDGLLKGRMSGLPKVADFRLDFTARNLNFTSKGIDQVMHGWAPRSKAAISKFAPEEELTFNGTISGLLDQLEINGDITTTDAGSLTADVGFDHLVTKGEPMQLGGNVATDNLDLGKMLNVNKLGPTTLRTSLEATLGAGNMSVRIDTLHVKKLHALGYDYSNIMGAGTYSQSAFDGRIICSDPNLNFLFQGIFTLSDKTSNGVYKFFADIGYADLEKMNLSKFGIKTISGQINANYINVGNKDLLGDLDLNNLVLENAQGRYELGDICMKSHSSDNIYRINLTSDMIDADYVGDKPLTRISGDLMQLTMQRDLPALLTKEYDSWNGERYSIDATIHDKKNILNALFPGFYIADSTYLNFDIKENGSVKANLRSPRIAKGRNYLRNLDLVLDNANGSINGTMTSTELNVASLNFKNNNTMLYADDNHFGFGVTYDNQTETDNRGELYVSGDLERDENGILKIHGNTLPSNIYHDGEGWSIAPSSFEVDGKDIHLNKISAVSNNQSISVEGGLSKQKKDTLKLELANYDINLLNNLLAQDLGVKGIATGKVYLISPRESSSGLLMNLTCDSLSIGGYSMGTLHVASALDNSSNTLNFIARNDLDGANSINVRGDYGLRNKKVDATVDLNDFNLGYASPFLASVFSKFEGNISGKIIASGTLNNLKLTSQDTKFDNALLQVAFTQVPYRLNGPFHLDETGLHFDDDQIKDEYDGTGVISGGLLFKGFKDFRLDTKIKLNQILALNTTAADNQSFNGKVFASGDVSIKGPFNAIFIDVNARTAKEGSIHIPIDNASNAKNSDLLTFKEEERYEYVDPYDVMMNNMETVQKKSNDFGVRLRINVNPSTEANVEVDRAAGNVLTGRGYGDIDLSVRPSRDIFAINGDYTISQGNFHFNAMNIAQRDFALSDGSSIRFNGDIMDSRLDITGVYTTKASVATLIADTTTVSARRTVNCKIGISGRLREPSLKFEIEIPDLDPTTQGKVESALNTEDKVQRQFLSLLISNTFLPNEQSGVVNNTATLYSSVAEIMAGQLNSILNKLNIPLDLGLNYQSSESGTNIFDVAVSTQLFNNRVIVNGAFGNRDYSNSGTQGSDVVGDIDIEIKLDKPGRVRLTLFSHSADDYTNYLDNTQRNGVGIAYQVEFNKFTDFVRRLFTPKKRREEAATEVQEKEKKVIKIEK